MNSTDQWPKGRKLPHAEHWPGAVKRSTCQCLNNKLLTTFVSLRTRHSKDLVPWQVCDHMASGKWLEIKEIDHAFDIEINA